MQAWDDLNQLSVQESVATHVVVTASGSDSQGWQLTGYGGIGGGSHNSQLPGEWQCKALGEKRQWELSAV